jgi:predicted nuclease of predicted toxin-antitoxin system
MKLLLDQGLPHAAAHLLQGRDIDATHVQDCGLAPAEDEEIIGYATRDQRVVVTLDADFHALLALSGGTEPSVIRIRVEGLKANALAELIERIAPAVAAEIGASRNVAVSVSETMVRYRRLPLS